MKTLLILLALLVSGCASAIFDFDPAFTADEQSQIMSGFAEWPSTTHVEVIKATDVIPRLDKCNPVDNQGNSDDLGITFVNPIKATVICLYTDRIAKSSVQDSLTRTSAHEYGHALGLMNHTADDEPASVMKAEIGKASAEITAFDLSRLAQIKQ